jgi:hypothetical protein
MLLGSADEQKPAADGTVEAWGRSPKNPVKGWYGLKKGLRAQSLSAATSMRKGSARSPRRVRRT